MRITTEPKVGFEMVLVVILFCALMLSLQGRIAAGDDPFEREARREENGEDGGSDSGSVFIPFTRVVLVFSLV